MKLLQSAAGRQEDTSEFIQFDVVGIVEDLTEMKDATIDKRDPEKEREIVESKNDTEKEFLKHQEQVLKQIRKENVDNVYNDPEGLADLVNRNSHKPVFSEDTQKAFLKMQKEDPERCLQYIDLYKKFPWAKEVKKAAEEALVKEK